MFRYPAIIILFLLSLSCGRHELRAPASLETSALSKGELVVRKRAGSYSGEFQGMREKGIPHKYQLVECSFIYEKGKDFLDDQMNEYLFERFSVNFMGKNAKGETAIDSVNYTHASHLKDFIPWDYSHSFGPVKLISGLKFGTKNNNGKMTFTKLKEGAKISFEHQDAYKTSQSSFYAPGETRHYLVEMKFKEFSAKQLILERIDIKSSSFLKERGSKVISTIECSQFTDQAE